MQGHRSQRSALWEESYFAQCAWLWLLSQRRSWGTKTRKKQNRIIVKILRDVTTHENDYICTLRQYPPTLHSGFYNLWRDNCRAFHLAQLELFRVNKHNLFLVSLIFIVLSFSLTSTINAFISRLPLVLQRHSPGTQLSHQPSKSSYMPPSTLCFILYSFTFAVTTKQWQRVKSTLCVSLNFYKGTLERGKIGQILYFSGLHFVSVSAIVLSSSHGMLAEWSRCTWQTLIRVRVIISAMIPNYPAPHCSPEHGTLGYD